MVVTVGRAVATAGTCGEPTTTAPTVGAIAIPLEEYHCALSLCKDDMEDMVPDTITELNNSLAECLTIAIDNAFIANLVGQGSTVDHGTNIIDVDWIAQTMGSMRNGNQLKLFYIA